MNDEIKELMKKRDRLHRVARKTNNICDWDSFRVARNEVMKTLRKEEKRFPKDRRRDPGMHVQNEIYKNKESNVILKVIRRCVPRKEISQPVYTMDMKKHLFYISWG